MVKPFTDDELRERIALARKISTSEAGRYFHSPGNRDTQFTQLQETQERIAQTFEELLAYRAVYTPWSPEKEQQMLACLPKEP